MAQQTAVEWLAERLIRMIPTISPIYKYDIKEYVEQAKEMEKEQIIKALDRGFDEGCKFPEDMTLDNAEQYYNETYNK
jgi:hypothetical protein